LIVDFFGTMGVKGWVRSKIPNLRKS